MFWLRCSKQRSLLVVARYACMFLETALRKCFRCLFVGSVDVPISSANGMFGFVYFVRGD